MRLPHHLARASFLALASLLILAGCRRAPSAPPGPSGPSVRDARGALLRLPAPPRRVLSLSPAATEVVFALGVGDRLVGRTESCDHPPAVRGIPSVGTLFPPDLERLAAAAPDLVLMTDGFVTLRTELEVRGIPVFVHQPPTVAAAVDALEALGTLLDAAPTAAPLAAGLRRRLAAWPRGGPKALYVVWHDPITAPGRATFLADALRHAGLDNVADGLSGDWPTVPDELLQRLDPTILIVGEALDLSAPAWRGLAAVRAGRVVRWAEPDLLVRPGPRLLDGVEALRAAVAALPAP